MPFLTFRTRITLRRLRYLCAREPPPPRTGRGPVCAVPCPVTGEWERTLGFRARALAVGTSGRCVVVSTFVRSLDTVLYTFTLIYYPVLNSSSLGFRNLKPEAETEDRYFNQVKPRA